MGKNYFHRENPLANKNYPYKLDVKNAHTIELTWTHGIPENLAFDVYENTLAFEKRPFLKERDCTNPNKNIKIPLNTPLQKDTQYRLHIGNASTDTWSYMVLDAMNFTLQPPKAPENPKPTDPNKPDGDKDNG